MPLFRLTDQKLEPVPNTTFAAEAILERKHLQKLLVTDVSPLGEDLMILAEEYGNWEDARRRIDLLCLDKQSRLVVIELKRTEDGGQRCAVNALDLESFRAGGLRVSEHDFRDINTKLALYGDPPFDGVIGSDILTPSLAIIDYKNCLLYLMDRR